MDLEDDDLRNVLMDNEDADVGDFEVRDQAEETEVQPETRTRRSTVLPTKAERELHEVTHLPFRNWCQVCMAARGVATAHKSRRMDGEHEIPILSLDYAFLKNEAGGDSLTVIVMKDNLSKAVASHVVPVKGAELEWTAQRIAKDITRWGYRGRVILKSDQEPAIVAFLEQVAQERGSAPTTLEHSPVTDSQSNGGAERGVRSMEEMVRTYKFDLESRLRTKISINHPILEWVVEHVADMLCKAMVGVDGKTPYQRLKGRKFSGEILPFASPVLF